MPLPTQAKTPEKLLPYEHEKPGRKLWASAKVIQILKGMSTVAKGEDQIAFNAQQVNRCVDYLRADGLYERTLVNDKKTTKRCLVFSGFEMEYDLNHPDIPQTHVAILSVNLLKDALEQNRAGLWPISAHGETGEWLEPDKSEWLPKLVLPAEGPRGTEDDKIKIGINGKCKGIQHAAKIMPSHICRGEDSKITKLKKSGYLLAYVPSPQGLVKKGWSQLKQLSPIQGITASEKQSARIVANYMLEAHQQGLHVEWTSHRDGAKVLTEAMEIVARSGLNLDKKQSIFLSDYTSSRLKADVARRKINMDCSDDKWYNATPGAQQIIGGDRFGVDTLVCPILEVMAAPEDKKTDKMIDMGTTTIKELTSKYGTGGLVVTLSELGFNFGMVKALVGALGNTALASVPSLNEEYHGSMAEPYKALARKLASLKSN